MEMRLPNRKVHVKRATSAVLLWTQPQREIVENGRHQNQKKNITQYLTENSRGATLSKEYDKLWTVLKSLKQRYTAEVTRFALQQTSFNL